MEELRVCSKCGETKPISDYPLNKGKPRRFCRVCLNRHEREHISKDRSKVRANYRKWADKDRDHVNALARESRARQDPEKLSNRQREARDLIRDRLRQEDKDRYWANPEKARADKCVIRRAAYWRDVEATRAKARAAYAARKQYFLAICHASRVRKAGSAGRYAEDALFAIFKLQKSKCAYCRKSLKDYFEVDHIIAVINGGTNDRRNLQLTCKHCNRSKSAKDPLVFARSLGRLL
jgi:5-methylcytosine-specific restriction endonuclease McrA